MAEHSGANMEVVEIYAYLHDCCREHDGVDPEHGARAAEFAESIRGSVIQLDDEDFETLSRACTNHTGGSEDADVTVQTCWDADRLDLGRVAIYPDSKQLFTEFAKRRSTIERAWEDSRKK